MLELFVAPDDRGSEKVRTFVQDHYLEDLVQLRDVSDARTRDAFLSAGGGTLPALWDGKRMTYGAEAAIAQLERFTNIGRAP